MGMVSKDSNVLSRLLSAFYSCLLFVEWAYGDETFISRHSFRSHFRPMDAGMPFDRVVLHRVPCDMTVRQKSIIWKGSAET